MASTKLSAEDKKAIVNLYKEVGQTAATVAEKYGVSVSTISRLLKSELPAEAYEALVRQKRGGGETKSKKRTSRKKPVSKLKKETVTPDPVAEIAEEPAVAEPETAGPETADDSSEATPTRRRRTRRTSEKKRPVSRKKSKQPEEEELENSAAAAAADDDAAASEAIELDSAAETEKVVTRKRRSIKRSRPKLKSSADDAEAVEESNAEVSASADLPEQEDKPESQPRRRRRRRRRTSAGAVPEEPADPIEVTSEEEVATDASGNQSNDAEDLQGDLLLDDLDDEAEDFDDAFDDDDDDLEDDDDGSDNITSLHRRSPSQDLVQIQPLSEANLSRMLYLVIDRTADLITMPMVFFSDLGQLPEEEEEKKTLPVFENHRVARRFSQRNQRVIKVPDGELISKTAPWLEAKGITRCLLDGQVYSLESVEH